MGLKQYIEKGQLLGVATIIDGGGVGVNEVFSFYARNPGTGDRVALGLDPAQISRRARRELALARRLAISVQGDDPLEPPR